MELLGPVTSLLPAHAVIASAIAMAVLFLFIDLHSLSLLYTQKACASQAARPRYARRLPLPEELVLQVLRNRLGQRLPALLTPTLVYRVRPHHLVALDELLHRRELARHLTAPI